MTQRSRHRTSLCARDLGLFASAKTRNRRLACLSFPRCSQCFQSKMAASSHWRPFPVVRDHCLSSGDRIRTCDLWVMSQPVAVSRRVPRLKPAGHQELRAEVITSRSTPSRQLRRVSFTNPCTTCLFVGALVVSMTRSSASLGCLHDDGRADRQEGDQDRREGWLLRLIR